MHGNAARVGLRLGSRSQPIHVGVGIENATSTSHNLEVSRDRLLNHCAVEKPRQSAGSAPQEKTRLFCCLQRRRKKSAGSVAHQARGVLEPLPLLSSFQVVIRPLLLRSPRSLGSICAVAAALRSAIRFSGDRSGLRSWRLGQRNWNPQRIATCPQASSMTAWKLEGSRYPLVRCSHRLLCHADKRKGHQCQISGPTWHHGLAACLLFG